MGAEAHVLCFYHGNIFPQDSFCALSGILVSKVRIGDAINSVILVSMAQVTIYSTPTCVYCNAAKKFFEEKGVSYTEYNVATDIEKRKQMIGKSGQMGVPVIDIGGELVIGFNQPKIKQLLGIA